MLSERAEKELRAAAILKAVYDGLEARLGSEAARRDPAMITLDEWIGDIEARATGIVIDDLGLGRAPEINHPLA